LLSIILPPIRTLNKFNLPSKMPTDLPDKQPTVATTPVSAPFYVCQPLVQRIGLARLDFAVSRQEDVAADEAGDEQLLGLADVVAAGGHPRRADTGPGYYGPPRPRCASPPGAAPSTTFRDALAAHRPVDVTRCSDGRIVAPAREACDVQGATVARRGVPPMVMHLGAPGVKGGEGGGPNERSVHWAGRRTAFAAACGSS
jgi:hypothetical protein